MTIRIAINGYGRIGRNILRAFFENPKQHDVEIIAINDLGNIEINAHLTRYDTTHGKFKGTIDIDKDYLIVNNQRINHSIMAKSSKQGLFIVNRMDWI